MKVTENLHFFIYGSEDELICELHGDPKSKSFDISIDGNTHTIWEEDCSEEDIDALIEGFKKFKQRMFSETEI